MPAYTFIEPVHTALKGRTRFRIKGLYRSESMRKFIETKLSGRNEVSSVTANVLTSNILVFFNSGNTAATISALLEEIVSEYQGFNGGSYPFDVPSARPERRKTSSVPRSPDKLISTKRKVRRLVTRAGPQRQIPWHQMEFSEALTALDTSVLEGLSSDSALARLKEYGPNLLPESVPRSGLSIFFGQLKSLPVLMLGVAAGISVLTGGLADAIVIMGVVGINSTIGYVTESQSEKTIFSLKKLVRPSAAVLRDGVLKSVKAEELVPGDIVSFRPGYYVPADCRLIASGNLSVDESALTGESMPSVKNPARLGGKRIPLADRHNMLYMGTLVTGGQAMAVVVATARFTELGSIQEMIGETASPKTPMEIQLDKMGNQLALVSGAVCGLVFLIGLVRGYGFLQMLKTSISLAVAAVPEGLPTVATTTLALGVRDMKKHRILVRRLEAIDTLGSIRTICLDKTGTITINTMSVVTAHIPGQELSVSDGLFYENGRRINQYENEGLLKLVHIGVLCNETEMAGESGHYVLNGTSTENAIVQMAISAGVDVPGLRHKLPLRHIEHRSENRNFMCTYHDFQPGKTLVAMKGSPAEVLAMCAWRQESGNKKPLTDEDREKILTDNERMAGQALRVLGIAYKISDKTEKEERCCFVWLGIIGMTDPVRKGAKELIKVLHGAGIDTVMITGDQTPTAYAIGKELNIGNNGGIEILDSTHLMDMDPEVMRALAQKVNVFSRVSPSHKLQIVQALQAAGRVVAMTGDGINDGPALKAADIGVAMGATGTDVAREIAGIIIEDDNLETLVVAVSRGRTIYNNIRKSVHFLIATNLSEIMVMLAATTAGLGQPLSAMQLLWINLISDIFPGLALALEPPEPDVLTQQPRDRNEQILKGSDFKRLAFEAAALSTGSLAAYGYGIIRYGAGPRASTLAFTSLTTGQLLHAISCRSGKTGIFSGESRKKLPPNRYLQAALAGSFLVQFMAMLMPGTKGLLGLAPLGVLDIGVAGMGAVAPLIVNEATKEKKIRGIITR